MKDNVVFCHPNYVMYGSVENQSSSQSNVQFLALVWIVGPCRHQHAQEIFLTTSVAKCSWRHLPVEPSEDEQWKTKVH